MLPAPRTQTCIKRRIIRPREWHAVTLSGGVVSSASVRCGRSAWEYLRAGSHIGRVVSTFSGGVNALFASNALISFQSPEVPLQPWAVEAMLPWERVCEDEAVMATGGHIRVGTLPLQLHHTEVLELQLSLIPETVSLPTLISHLEVLKDLKRCGSGAECTPLSARFDAKWRSILDMWVCNRLTCGLSRLIGLGMGLTPTGDDILVGILGGLEVLERILGTGNVGTNDVCATLDRLRAAIRKEAPERTNLASCQALCSATEGRFCEVLLHLLDVLCQPGTTTREILSCAQSVLCLGHTSGMDLLTGVIAALEWDLAISNQRQRACFARAVDCF